MRTKALVLLVIALIIFLSCNKSDSLDNETIREEIVDLDESIDNFDYSNETPDSDDNIIFEESLNSSFGKIAPNRWMSKIEGDTYLNNITIPGTHESGTNNGNGGAFAKCQNYSLEEQLNMGVRFLDIRVRYHDGNFLIHHGAYYQHLNFNDVLRECQGFLRKNSEETIVLSLKEEYSDRSANLFREKFLEYVKPYKLKGKNNMDYNMVDYEINKIPKLKDVRGKVILLRRFNKGDSNKPLGIDASNGWIDNGLGGMTNSDNVSFMIQDVYKIVFVNRKKDNISAAIKYAKDDKPINLYQRKLHLNFTSGFYLSPVYAAKFFNPYISDELSKSENQTNKLGFIIADFVYPSLVTKMYMTNFQN